MARLLLDNSQKLIQDRRITASKIQIDLAQVDDPVSASSKVEESKITPETTLSKFKLNWDWRNKKSSYQIKRK